MSAPIYRDPAFDGATDPTVIWNRLTGQWWMFYTQRRATLDAPGVEWVHGSRIGIAVSVESVDSVDDGARWEYGGVVEGLDAGVDAGAEVNTHWAPEVIDDGEQFHMYLTWIAGTPDRWEGHLRRIVHFTSPDLVGWSRQGALELSSDRVIDAAVERTADGRHRLWYKDEADDSTTWSAVSDDLFRWDVEGQSIGGAPHEGPNVFRLGEWCWLITDEWRGQAVYRSADGIRWQRQGLVLGEPGSHADDRQVARHADVVVQGDHAIAFYFTHPYWDGSEIADASSVAQRRSAIHIARLDVRDGVLVADRDISPELALTPPA